VCNIVRNADGADRSEAVLIVHTYCSFRGLLADSLSSCFLLLLQDVLQICQYGLSLCVLMLLARSSPIILKTRQTQVAIAGKLSCM
jgi:hypothetical protein